MDCGEDLDEDEIMLQNHLSNMLKYNSEQIFSDMFELKNIMETIDELYTFWCPVNCDIYQLFQRNIVFFGDQQSVLQRYRTFLHIPIMLQTKLNLIKADNQDETKEDFENSNIQTSDNVEMTTQEVITLEDKLIRIMINIENSYNSVCGSYKQLMCNDPNSVELLLPVRFDKFITPLELDDLKPHQKFIKRILLECKNRQYRKVEGELYAPFFTDLGDFTRTYIHVGDTLQFVYDTVYPITKNNIWMWSALTDKPGIAKFCAEYLEKCKDDCLPTLKRDRTKFSFKNGIFDASLNVFYNYKECYGLGQFVCANYIDLIFEDSKYSKWLENTQSPLSIPTPNIQMILDSQCFSDEVCLWFYASMGRMIFDIGDKDNWQYFPFCKGTAGSGKSSLLKLVAQFYNATDIGNLMSEGQKNFSVEHIYKRFVFFCYDVDDKMNFSLTRWNQMVSGETIAIERKFKVPIQKNWTVPGGFAGNTYPPWVDQAGNVSRRMLIFLFRKVITKVDPRLDSKCKLELAAFMKKCITCYFSVLDKHGDKGIWDTGVLPEFFHETKRDMQSSTNPLQAFIHSDQCIIGENEHTSYSSFRVAYISYCDMFKLPKKSFQSEDQHGPVFVPLNIKIVEPNGDDDIHFGHMSKYILGVGLRE